MGNTEELTTVAYAVCNCADASSGDQMDFGNGTDLQTTIAHFLDVLRETGGKAAFAKVRDYCLTVCR